MVKLTNPEEKIESKDKLREIDPARRHLGMIYAGATGRKGFTVSQATANGMEVWRNV